jgi:glycosyltransferase involved in cell wall biosynthesis
VSIQFQEAIWGGEDGEAVLDFVRALGLPYVVTLHTLHRDPTQRQREVLTELLESAGAVVVMSHAAAETVTGTYGIDKSLVEVIRYGVPDLPVMADTVKTSVGLEGRRVLLSFGLLDPGKGFELVIDALPAILATQPTTTYVIVGATHPDVRLRDGEAYRISLASRAAALGVSANVRFVPEFVGRVELARWMQAADVFITPNPDLDSMVSGTLSLAMAAGRAIVSTPYPYAVELLADGRGELAAPTAKDIAAAVLKLLGDDASRTAMGASAHDHSRSMVWTRVGAEYQAVFARVAASGPMIQRGRTRSVATPR